ncbi:signal peptidase I [Patescibacteria group bacterium]|nr:signal peptidase I [Patescibacteria group bacterium]MBU1759182.1 signal peptidase I [Patescibacteria group bacterium]MBU1907373.1 signal peptidase I [Patescibacteria group bacterium]
MFKRNNEDTFWHRRLGPTLGAVALFILEVVQIVIISAAIIIPIRYFLIQPFYVKGASMEPNFFDHEYLIIDEITYRFDDPVRGEIVVFRYPENPSEFFIKRVVALPGETVEITDGKVIIYNNDNPSGIVLDETYLDVDQTFGKKRVSLNEDEYFVLGDNRDKSLDSRTFGPIRRSDIVGRVWLRGLPLSRINVFDIPDYNL